MSPTTRKPSGVRRREIAEAALRVIGEQGATSLTAASLAAEVGVTPGALFRHFASIDEILGAAVEVAVEAFEGTFPDAGMEPIERLRALALARVRLMRRTPGLAWLMLSDQVWLTVPEDGLKRLRALVKRSRKFLLAGFTEGIASGELRDDLAPETLLPIFTGTIHSLIAKGGVHRRAQASPEPIVDALFTLLAKH